MFRRYFILQLYSLHSLGFSKEEENWQKANFYLQYENILSYIIGFLVIPLIANLLIYFSDKKKLLVGNVPPELHNDYLQMYFESERMVGESVTVTVTSVDSDSNTCGTIVEFKEEFRKWMFYSCRYSSPAIPFRQRFSPTKKKTIWFPRALFYSKFSLCNNNALWWRPTYIYICLSNNIIYLVITVWLFR